MAPYSLWRIEWVEVEDAQGCPQSVVTHKRYGVGYHDVQLQQQYHVFIVLQYAGDPDYFVYLLTIPLSQSLGMVMSTKSLSLKLLIAWREMMRLILHC